MKFLTVTSIGFYILAFQGMPGCVSSTETALSEVRRILASLQKDPRGINHIGDDGIARSFSWEGQVIDAVRLSNELMMGAVEMRHSEEERQILRSKWAGVDGFGVSVEQMWSPPIHVLPLLFAQPELYEMLMEQPLGQDTSPNPQKLGLERRSACYSIVCRYHTQCFANDCGECNIHDHFIQPHCEDGYHPSSDSSSERRPHFPGHQDGHHHRPPKS
ncbi:hypothetical protein ACJ72_04316 [Emergomyces africanus]|uniref:Uncharacterized protein n=1 Tax=Emergomyces africanus TaxID=1955775 RepID=A0A1B7NX57_9EURO|nr:hypothetical protein ACJ72_04316 [Emergomyces africanus]